CNGATTSIEDAAAILREVQAVVGDVRSEQAKFSLIGDSGAAALGHRAVGEAQGSGRVVDAAGVDGDAVERNDSGGRDGQATAINDRVLGTGAGDGHVIADIRVGA